MFNIALGAVILFLVFRLASTWGFVLPKRAMGLFLTAALLFTGGEVVQFIGLFTAPVIAQPASAVVTTLCAVCLAVALYLITRSERHEATALIYLSEKDALTELKSIPYFRWLASQIVKKARKGNTPAVLMMVSLDDFADYDREFGEEASNYAIQRAAQALRDTARLHDLLARHGNAEFVALMLATREAADKIAERIQARIEAICTPESDPLIYRPLTVSISVAPLGATARTVDELIEAAHGDLRQTRGGHARGTRDVAGQPTRLN